MSKNIKIADLIPEAVPTPPHPESKDYERKIKLETFGGKEFEVVYRKGVPGKTKEEMLEMIRAAGQNIGVGFSYCPPLKHHTYEAAPGIICKQDVPIKMRDGVTIYADIYRPITTAKIPVIVSWGMFGKRAAEGVSDWQLMGVPPQTVSKMAKFESADPGYWCYQGYAVANVDERGVGNSEGDIETFGTQEGRDGYDTIEWLAVQDWCNGKVTLFGNSGVCMSNWKIAAEQPPHLCCIAAWEGIGDLYRESFSCGGVPNPDYHEHILNSVACKGWIEDITAMLEKYPYMNEYWEDKITKWENITIPAYCTCGWVHHHLRGSLEGFRRIKSPKKWLRAHRDFEWPDSYNRDNLEDLKKFWDRYCKDINNGWEFTPRVRLDVMDAYTYDYASKRPENEFPLKRTIYKNLYFDAATGGASFEQYPLESEVTYDPKTEVTCFDYKFTEDTEITGYMYLHLWIECRGHDNMDIFPWVIKLGQNGEFLPLETMGGHYRGAWGFRRCSYRDNDPKYTTSYQPVGAHWKEERMKPGEIFPIDIELYPHSRIWHKGETLRVQIAGYWIKTDWFHDGNMNYITDNGDGTDVIHTGGRYDSFLRIPTIPPKYTSGDYVYDPRK
jgi:predicted acyl esterase